MSIPPLGEERHPPVAALPLATIAMYGTVAPFDGTQEEWSEYAERLVHYFTANDITGEDKRRAILLNAVGPATYRLIKTLASPAKVTELSFEEIVARTTSHFNPKPSPIVKRYEFNTRCQGEGESIATYVAELRKIAEHCDYGNVLSDMLRDRLVCGIRDRTTQRHLLRETALTFEKALQMALAAEAADKDSRRLTGATHDKDLPALGEERVPPVSQASVHRVGMRKPQHNTSKKQGSPKSGQEKSECYRCGGKHHPSGCPCKEYVCHFCKKRGHLAKVCRKKAHDRAEQTNVVSEQQTVDDPEYEMFHVHSGPSQPYRAVVTANGLPVSMEIDTGASISIVNEETFKTIRNGESTLELQDTTVKLKTYTGAPITVCGSTVVPVEHNGQAARLPLVVTAGNGPNLLGRDWLSALCLDWKTIFSIGTSSTLQQVLEEHSDVFKEGLGELRDVEAKIYVDAEAEPRFHKARKVPFAIREKVEEELDRLQSMGVIQPIQFSDWAAPIVPVMKRDGRVRICGDYKVTVNRAAKLDKYPIPHIEELFASLAGGKAFTKLDLSHAYLQIPLEEKSQRYVAINTHKGLFEYKRLPFGVASAPSIFQRVMENLLQGISGVCVYIDDILVTGATEGQHLHNLAQVLQRLQTAGMKLKKEKCAFLLPSVSYLGHIISAEGLHTEDAKVQAIVKAPEPQNVAELRSFLGMVNYYGKFLPDLATTLAPLYSLLQRSTPWQWGAKQREAFRHVKDLLQSGRVLTHFDDQLPLILACDASPYGLGVVLSHRMPNGEERPVGFASRTLTQAEKNYSHLDKEALAIVYGVKKYHQYLYGRRFEIKTDHKPLTHIFKESRVTPTMASGRIQRWALTLGGYDYVIQYKEGKSMANADALSRLPIPTMPPEVPRLPEVVHLVNYLDSTPLSSAQIRVWTDNDPILSVVRRRVQEGWTAEDKRDLLPFFRKREELSTEVGCVLRGCRVVIPRKGRKRALNLLHEAHPGMVRMKSLARSYMWWPGLDKDIEECVKECPVCQSTRKLPPVVPLHPWSLPERVWSRVHIDYAGPVEGKMFLLVIDAYSKWLEVHVTNTSTSTATIELLRKSFATLGLPEVIVSDNATTFTSEEFAEFLKKNGIRHIRSPPYHPASNGLVERAVQTFKEGLKRLKAGSLNTRVCQFLLRYRITPHSSTGSSPSELMMGRKLRTQLDLLHPDASSKAQQCQDRQKRAHDAHSRQRQFAVGDTVYARNYRQGPVWLPGSVVGLEGSTVYKICLNDNRVVRRHADQLRVRAANCGTGSPAPSDALEDIPSPSTGNEASTAEPETAGTEQNSSEVESQTGTQNPVNSSTPMSDVSLGATETSSEQRPPTAEASDHSVPELRRSIRERRPPDRFGEQCHVINLNVVSS